MTSERQILFFGGSFDPLHIGHTSLLNCIYYAAPYAIDEIWLVPTFQNPLKEKIVMSFEERVSLLSKVFCEDRRFHICHIEEELPLPHYTIDTLSALEKKHPSYRFTILIGADNWVTFDQWYHHDLLLKKYRIFIYPRRGFDIQKEYLPQGVYYLDYLPLIEVSSTQIRQAIIEGRDLRYLLPLPTQYSQLEIAYKKRSTL